ncbi:hypothetical protein DKX38_025988 [Salix brachista]|uniref:Uncharacterized protein n=1 Tax=Salix brachista TaxID=2182728 RepID=A0A5N5JR09_9ROSI|nr:hypothetical protein DKX38_025988 [Salix brachista]
MFRRKAFNFIGEAGSLHCKVMGCLIFSDNTRFGFVRGSVNCSRVNLLGAPKGKYDDLTDKLWVSCALSSGLGLLYVLVNALTDRVEIAWADYSGTELDGVSLFSPSRVLMAAVLLFLEAMLRVPTRALQALHASNLSTNDSTGEDDGY